MAGFGATARILVIDDSRDFQVLVRTYLNGTGWTVHGAADALQATGMALREKPKLILLDIGLPGGDGFMLLDRLHAGADEAVEDAPDLVVEEGVLERDARLRGERREQILAFPDEILRLGLAGAAVPGAVDQGPAAIADRLKQFAEKGRIHRLHNLPIISHVAPPPPSDDPAATSLSPEICRG